MAWLKSRASYNWIHTLRREALPRDGVWDFASELEQFTARFERSEVLLIEASERARNE